MDNIANQDISIQPLGTPIVLQESMKYEFIMYTILIIQEYDEIQKSVNKLTYIVVSMVPFMP